MSYFDWQKQHWAGFILVPFTVFVGTFIGTNCVETHRPLMTPLAAKAEHSVVITKRLLTTERMEKASASDSKADMLPVAPQGSPNDPFRTFETDKTTRPTPELVWELPPLC